MRCLPILIVIALACWSSAEAAEYVAGTASYRERIALPPGAVFEAVLEDVSFADAPAVELGRTTMTDPGNPPFRFKIDFDQKAIEHDHIYSVRAQVSVGRKLIFVSDKANPVITGGAPSEVSIWMIKVGDTAKEAQSAPTLIGAHGLRLPASFEGDLPCDDCEALRIRLDLWPDQVFHLRREWRGTDERRDAAGRWSVDPDRRVLVLRGAEESHQFAILGPERIRLLDDAGVEPADPAAFELAAAPEFQPIEPHLALRGILTYTAEEARFTECLTGRDYPLLDEGDFAALEHAFLAAGTEPGGAIMTSFDGAIRRPNEGAEDAEPKVLVERFVGVWPGESCERAEGTASLTNTYWKVLRLGDSEIAAHEGSREPNLILREHQPRFSATVGCNQMSGAYTLSGDALGFGPTASTKMGCPPPIDQWEAKLAGLLERTAGYRIDGQTLELLDAGGTPLGLFQAVYRY